jgi:hypothetical protein
MDGMNTFIHNASHDTGMSAEFCDKVICSMVKAVNNNALDGPTQLAQLSRLKKKKFTNINNVSTIVANDLNEDRENCKKVVSWMIEMMIRTQDQGGMPALIRMANLMKKGQQAETKSVDYSDEVKDINDMLKKQGKE